MSNNTNDYPSCIKMPSTKKDHKNVYETVVISPLFKQLKKTKLGLLSALNKVFGEEKWNCSLSNQTLDFVDSASGVYTVGCYTLIKIQLDSGIYREDMGYSIMSGTIKGETIHCARYASYNDALINVLHSFGGNIEAALSNIFSEKLSNYRKVKEDAVFENDNDSSCRVAEVSKSNIDQASNELVEVLPIFDDIVKEATKKESINKFSNSRKEKEEAVFENENGSSCSLAKVSKSNTDQVPLKKHKSNLEDINNKNLSEEELRRQERKKRQMERQMEFKKFMKEKSIISNNKQKE